MTFRYRKDFLSVWSTPIGKGFPMKFSGRQIGSLLATSSFLMLVLPATGQDPAFSPAIGPTYLQGFGPQDLPRADAAVPSTESAAQATVEQPSVQTSKQISDAEQDPALSAVLQTAFTPKTQDPQQ